MTSQRFQKWKEELGTNITKKDWFVIVKKNKKSEIWLELPSSEEVKKRGIVVDDVGDFNKDFYMLKTGNLDAHVLAVFKPETISIILDKGKTMHPIAKFNAINFTLGKELSKEMLNSCIYDPDEGLICSFTTKDLRMLIDRNNAYIRAGKVKEKWW